MRSPVAYYLLLLYLAVICKPIVPLIQDIVAHTFFKYEHLRTVHQHGGKNHVDVELSNTAKEDAAGNGSDKLKSPDEVSVHFPVKYEAPLAVIHPQVLIHTYYDPLSNLPLACMAIQVPPPRS